VLLQVKQGREEPAARTTKVRRQLIGPSFQSQSTDATERGPSSPRDESVGLADRIGISTVTHRRYRTRRSASLQIN